MSLLKSYTLVFMLVVSAYILSEQSSAHSQEGKPARSVRWGVFIETGLSESKALLISPEDGGARMMLFGIDSSNHTSHISTRELIFPINVYIDSAKDDIMVLSGNQETISINLSRSKIVSRESHGPIQRFKFIGKLTLEYTEGSRYGYLQFAPVTDGGQYRQGIFNK